MTHFVKSFWTYLVHERLGYRRPARPLLPVLPDDDAIREVELQRLHRLETSVKWMDANLDLLRASKLRREQQ